MLTLESFEQAAEIVKQVTQETKLVYSELFQRIRPAIRFTSNRKICSVQEHTRFVALIIRSVPCRKKREIRD